MPPLRRDAAHRFFDYDASINASTCNLCGKRVKGRHTSNLKSHLAIKHTNEFNEVQEANREMSINMYRQKTAEDNPKNPIPRIKKLCVRLVAVSGFPLDTISCEAFQNILNLAVASNGRSDKISEDAIKEMIIFCATDIKQKIAEEIRNKLIYLLVSTAFYKSHKFLGIFIKYTFQDKIIVRNLLTTKCVKSEMGDFLIEMLSEVIKDFQIPKDHIYSVTTGSYQFENDKELLDDKWAEASANNANSDQEDASEEENQAAEREEDQVAEESEEFSHQDFIENLLITDNGHNFTVKNTFCGVKILHLPIKDAIEENMAVQEILNLAQNICKILDSGTNRKLLKSAKVKAPTGDFTTKWKSIYKMLSRLRKLRDFCESIDDIPSTGLVESEFWKELDNLLNCLEPFNKSSLVLQNEQLTIGDFFIQWMTCKSKVESMRYHFASSLLMAMESREKDILNTDVVLEALYLDSRLNILLSEEQCERAKVFIKQTWKFIQTIEEDSQDPLDDSSNQSNITVKVEFDCDSAQPGPSTRAQSATSLRSDLMGLEKMLMRAERAQGRATKRVTSFEVLLQELRAAPRLPLDTDILSHWSSKPTNTELDKVATTVLAAPVTQISPKSMWSALSFLLNPVRNKLDSNLLQNMLLIRTNEDLLE